MPVETGMSRHPDIIVIGAGHAGCEAALAAARLGRSVYVVSLSREHIGRLSCNPAIGGLAKGNLVREIDALGGGMARIADLSSIQFRRLNTRKGLAVQSSRAQVDIDVYPKEMAKLLLSQPKITFVEGEASEIITKGGRVSGARLGCGRELEAGAVILTTGTFLSGVMHCGQSQVQGGRVGEGGAVRLARNLLDLGLRLGRLKTGTTPRLDGRTIDWDRTDRQAETVPEGRFSYRPKTSSLPQIDCHIAYTNQRTHEIIRQGLSSSPLFSGQIVGTGPRYCPSIEDKVVRFKDRDRHLLFLEPEGLGTDRVYVNGLSTSLPGPLQEELVHSIEGLEKAEILQYGYAVEYDYCDPTDLDHGLQHSGIPGLFLAGQINGTSGYEEAAAQGLVAGASAAIGSPFVLGREQAYIGVLIDDLVTRGVGGEPYRMFSSRAEHRLLLREDNADRRLVPVGKKAGLVDPDDWSRYQAKEKAIEQLKSWCTSHSTTPTAATRERFASMGVQPPRSKASVSDLLRRPEIQWEHIGPLIGSPPPEADPDVVGQVVTDTKYAGYLERERRRAEQTRKLSSISLPTGMDYRIPGVSYEVAERLEKAKPVTLGAAARLPGITPAAIDTLAIYLAKRR
jgi:tRNA uridine 5-carboxymethylaminomethyl modification enzyme